VPIAFLNAALLIGLAAVALPPIIHLLTRKKFDVAPWAAMQFLDDGNRTRRRMIWDELLLMAVRMGAIAALVLALAAPAETAGWLARFRQSRERDIVLIVDRSASMGVGLPANAAKQWAMMLVEALNPGDRLAVIQAGSTAKVIAPLSADHDAARSAIQSLPAPHGDCNGPAAVSAALQVLADRRDADCAIICVSDGQRYGWADDATTSKWDSLGKSMAQVRLSFVRLAPDRPADLPRWILEPLKSSRALAVADQPLTIRGGLRRLGSGDIPEPVARLEIDGQPIGPVEAGLGKPIEIRRSFTSGSHLVSLRLSNSESADLDRQDLVVNVVPSLPVLIVDGDDSAGPRRHGVEFLHEALSPTRDPSPTVAVRVVPISNFGTPILARDVAGPDSRPRVLILADVPRLTSAQSAAIEEFLQAGGGVLVALGDRADAAAYTRDLYKSGRGWLPAAVGASAGPGDPAKAPSPLSANFRHPALELFRQPGAGSLSEARFPRWRNMTVPNAPGVATIARLAGDVPLFVESGYGNGRVIVSAVPLDDSNRSNLVELPAFAPLVHELTAYLAAARTQDRNLAAGQPVRFDVPKSAPQSGWQVRSPDGVLRPLDVANGAIIIDSPESGAYAFTHSQFPTQYFAIAADPKEHDLTPLDAADRERLEHWLPSLHWDSEPGEALASHAGAALATELNWLAFGGVIALLCMELWMTRKRALAANG
jgi:VWA domain-containing protein/aerotolerance regulator-like protein